MSKGYSRSSSIANIRRHCEVLKRMSMYSEYSDCFSTITNPYHTRQAKEILSL